MDDAPVVVMSGGTQDTFIEVLNQLLTRLAERDDMPEKIVITPANGTMFPYRLYYSHEVEYVGGVIEVKAPPFGAR